MKQKISIVRGTTNSFSITVTDEDGDIYELASGEVLRFGVKWRAEDTEYLIEKEMTSADVGSDGEYTFTISISDTDDLPFGTYFYDVGLQSGVAYYNVIPVSEFIIGKNITAWEE